MQDRHDLALPGQGLGARATRLLRQGTSGSGAHGRAGLLNENTQAIVGTRVLQSTQGQHGGALHLHIAIPAKPKQRIGQGALPDGVGCGQQLKTPGHCQSPHLRFVLGSSDPRALEIARRHGPVDLFNLSFTPPERIEVLHAELAAGDPTWKRERLPRTVLVFADPSARVARERADAALDVYIEAMRGTAQVPDKQVLLARALVGDAAELRERLAPGGSHGFHPHDRLMLWFEFNQLDGAAVEAQMRYFFEHVVAKL